MQRVFHHVTLRWWSISRSVPKPLILLVALTSSQSTTVQNCLIRMASWIWIFRSSFRMLRSSPRKEDNYFEKRTNTSPQRLNQNFNYFLILTTRQGLFKIRQLLELTVSIGDATNFCHANSADLYHSKLWLHRRHH